MQHSDTPGLSITYATDEFLLATKLVAQRRKDASDIVALAGRLGMQTASAPDLEELISRYYIDRDALEFILDGKDIERELRLLAVRAERLLARHQSGSSLATAGDGARPPAVHHQDRGTSRGRG